MTDIQNNNTGKSLLALVAFLAVVIGMGSLIGIGTAPGGWYAGLQKPFFNPPNWIFGPVWFVLYVCIGIAGWLIWRVNRQSGAMKAWVAQIGLNWLWSPIFFSFHLLWPALFVILAIFGLVAVFIRLAWGVDKRASLLFVPYLMWVGFASALNFSVALLN